MALLLTAAELDPLLTVDQAIDVLEAALREQAAATAVEFPTIGGSKRGLLRVVGGTLFGAGHAGVRVGLSGALTILCETGSWRPLAVLGAPFSHLRVGATLGLAARYLAPPAARRVGMLGSGKNGLAILASLCAVREIEQVAVFSPTAHNREAFAQRASAEIGRPVVARETPEAALDGADIIIVATNSPSPVLRAADVRPGVHVTSMGLESELDASLYLRADQIVATNAAAEVYNVDPAHQPEWREVAPLHTLLADERLAEADVVDLSAIVTGEVAPRNGPGDVTVFRESRGGIGDIALAAYAYEAARANGIGVEFDFGSEERADWRPEPAPRQVRRAGRARDREGSLR